MGMFLYGERVMLRPLERVDLTYIRLWANDPEVRRLTGEVTPMSEAAADAYYERLTRDESRIGFIIERQEDRQPIGECGLLRIFYPWRTTDLSIILGDKTTWGQGYGTEAVTLLLDYAFGYLGLHRVAIGVVAFNTRALHFYEKIGFQREGVQEQGYYYNHAFHDFVMLRILEDEFRASISR